MIKIRKASLQDELQVFELLRVLFSLSLPEDEVRDWQAAINQYRKMVEDDKRGTIIVAEEDGALVGLITSPFLRQSVAVEFTHPLRSLL